MSNKKGFPYPVIIAIGLVILLVFGAAITRSMFFFLCVFIGFAFLYFYLKDAKVQKAHNTKNTGVKDTAALKDIRRTILHCDQQIQKLEKEIQRINSEIKDVEVHILPGKDIRPEALEESLLIISRFEEQLALRKTKINFFSTCKQKLESLRDNHILTQKLEDKQKTLQQLQENQYEELANMESLKANLEHEVTYLKTIDQLSLRMLNSQSLQEAEALKVELITVSKELKNL